MNSGKRRNALKMLCGWPTFPVVFVKEMLVGGANDLRELIDNDKLKKILAVWAAYAAEHYKLDSSPRDILLG